jgi:hypothetical protein|tara:strand:- start:1738 stop:2334 length:597 start_codon:yes stop_codon:yes gene_type:complete
MSKSKSESRVLDVFGPNLVIESNGPVGLGGPIAYQLYAVTDKGAKWQQALHGSGLASMEADHTLEIQTGKKNKKEHISYMAMAHNGDMCITAENGWVRIQGSNIVLNADNEILLQGKRVTLGNADGSTSQTEILGNKIVINGAQEVFVVGSQKISKSGKGLFLKSSIINAMASNPATGSLIAAFVPSGFGARIRPGER